MENGWPITEQDARYMDFERRCCAALLLSIDKHHIGIVLLDFPAG